MTTSNEEESKPNIVNLVTEKKQQTEKDGKEHEKLTDFKLDDRNMSNYSSIVNGMVQQPQQQPKSMSTRQRRSYHVELAIQKNYKSPNQTPGFKT